MRNTMTVGSLGLVTIVSLFREALPFCIRRRNDIGAYTFSMKLPWRHVLATTDPTNVLLRIFSECLLDEPARAPAWHTTVPGHFEKTLAELPDVFSGSRDKTLVIFTFVEENSNAYLSFPKNLD
ncbi:hypothetical protein AKJ16_DCAP10925 [Drosera capensis]